MGAPHRGKTKVERVTVGLPEGIYRQIEIILEESGQWMSVVDFLRDAAKEKVDRWKREGHYLPAGPGPADLGKGFKRGDTDREDRRSPSP